MKDYHNGPIPNERRSCTDTFCCLLLAILMLAMLIFGIYAWSTQNFSKLTTPYDAEGKGCGVDYPQHPLIYFVSPEYDTLWRTVCVKSCPTGNQQTLDCRPNKYITSCAKIESADSNVAVHIYPTTSIRNTICLPTSQSLQEKLSSAIGKQTWQGKIATIGNVWPILLSAIPIAIVLSIIFMLFVRCTAGFFVYLLLAVSVLACLVLGIYLIAVPHQTVVGVAINRAFAIIIGILLILFAVFIGIGLICYRKRIRLASVIVQVSARFVKQNCSISILPFIIFLITAAFLALWILEALGFYSLGEPIRQEKQWPFQYFKTTNLVKALIVIHIFQLFWVICFFVQSNDFIVSGTVTSWYYRRSSPFSQSMTRYRRYHIGSVAFGAFLMALFGFIRFIYELLTPQKAQQTGCMANWKKFCDCCCYLCISYIFNCFNSGAYTFIHIAGQGYCNSAFQVVSLRLKEPIITAVVAFLSALFSILIRVGITALTVLICYIIFKNAQPYRTNVPDTTFANILIGILSFAISSFFVSLYSEAMEAIFVCYLVDRDAGGPAGQTAADEKAPQELKQFLNQARVAGHFTQ